MKRITKAEAKKRFFAGEIIVLCPHKFRPEGPFSMGATISSQEYKRGGDSDTDTWNRMYNYWSFYNASYETGYYPHYYVS